MARHTECTTVSGVWDGVPGVDMAFGIIGALGLITAPVVLAIAALSAAGITPVSMTIAATILMFACLMAIDLIHKVREYFFDRRLICLGDDRCAMAQVITMEDNGDGDKSMNTILGPANSSTTEADYQNMFQAQSLVYVDPGLATRGFHLDPFKARGGTFGAGLPFFHCEIEGTYLDSLTIALIAWLWTIFAIAVAALALAAVLTALGPLAWAIWIAVALLIILAILALGLFGSDDTDSVDAGPLGDATPSPTGPIITDAGGHTINQNDFVALIGRPVCDTGHNKPCWDELHPLKGITKIQEAEYNRAPTTHSAGDLYDRYCEALQGFVDDVGKVEQGLTSVGTGGEPKLTCLEHETIG